MDVRLLPRGVRFLLISLIIYLGTSGAVDDTLNDEATGSDVVHAVIAKLDASGLFDSDHHLLRRLAFVETDDGAMNHNLCSDNGGLWALETLRLNQVLSAPELASIRTSTQLMFGIEWAQVTKDDMCKPFYSGLAARMYLAYIDITIEKIPFASDFEKQAQFWITYYHLNTGAAGNITYFVEKVTLLEKQEGCKVNTDIFFVLDGSGSIGSQNFDQVQQFEYDFVSKLSIGPQDNQVGTIVFSTIATVDFYLNTYVNKTDVLDGISTLPYPGGSTNTPDGLCKLARYGFADGNGARPSSAAVYRIAIVMTDGKSNKESSECQWDTLEAAEAIHKLSPPILVYVIGVTDNVDVTELETIATSPDYVTYLDSFDRDILEETQESHADEVCNRATLPADPDEELNGTLDQNETVRYHYPIPVVGITVSVCISVGHIVVYGSFSVPNPNSAYYDWILELEFELIDSESEICTSIYIDPSDIHPKPSTNSVPSATVTRTQPSSYSTSTAEPVPQPTVVPGSGNDNNVELSDVILYISVLGKQDENNFILNGTVGDNTPHDTTPETTTLTVATTPHVTPDVTTDETDNKDELFIIVVTSGAGFVTLLFVCLIFFCGFCCYLMCRKPKTNHTNDYKLLPRKTETVWIGED